MRKLPTPQEAADNLLIWVAEQGDGSPGRRVKIVHEAPEVLAIIGVSTSADIEWVIDTLRSQGLIAGGQGAGWDDIHLTASGWQRFDELQRAHTSSRYAFFARKFNNSELDLVFGDCLVPAVKQTGYELRTVTQRGGLVDAIIEDEIRRCRFLIADLSDDNAGAYWEAGFAEGLGKDVIYICRAHTKDDAASEMKTHFDTNHRHTVRWDLSSLDQTAKELKAVIRNTLLQDANQTD
jgi:hypothetical protein